MAKAAAGEQGEGSDGNYAETSLQNKAPLKLVGQAGLDVLAA